MANDELREILSKILDRRNKIRDEAEALDNLIRVYQGLILAQEAESRDPIEQPDLYQGSSTRAVKAAQIANAIDAARRLIIEQRRPMRRDEIVTALEGRGFKFPGKDKNKVFGTNIWRSGKFRTIESKGYWPKDVSLPRD